MAVLQLSTWEPLPSYAPELNPVAGVWEHLKYVELRNLCCGDLPQLSTDLRWPSAGYGLSLI
jgi:transposase